MRHTYTRICGIIFIIALAALIADVLTSDNQVRTYGPVIALQERQKLPVVIDGDTTLVTVAPGDSVRVLGFDRRTSHQDILVETAGGDRGKLDASQLPIRQLIIDGKNKGDTVIRLVPEYLGLTVHKYLATTTKGEELNLRADDMVPLVDEWKDLNLDNIASTSVATQKGLEKMRSKTLEEIERKYGMAYNILAGKDSTMAAGFRIYTYGSDGRLYRPCITFDSEGKATDFAYRPVRGKADNRWALGYAPFAGMIIDLPLTRLLTRSSSYTIPSDTGKPVPWYMYVALVVMLVAILAWYCLIPSLAVLLVGWLIAYPPVFRPLSNKTLKVIIYVLAAVGFYWWAIALMAWGLYWFMVLPIIPVSYYCIRWATEYISDEKPHERCPRCKHIHTISFDHDEVTGTQYMKGKDIKRDKLLSEQDEKYQSWVEVTTRYTDGTRTTRRENVRDHKRRHRLYSYIDYEVTYLVTFYRDYYICSHCGFEETDTHLTREEVDRQEVGMHTDIESHDVY